MLLLPGYFEDKMLENFLKEDDKKKKKARELPASTNDRRRENTWNPDLYEPTDHHLCVCVCVCAADGAEL